VNNFDAIVMNSGKTVKKYKINDLNKTTLVVSKAAVSLSFSSEGKEIVAKKIKPS